MFHSSTGISPGLRNLFLQIPLLFIKHNYSVVCSIYIDFKFPNLTLPFLKERSISLIYPHFGHLISIFPVVIVILSKTHHSPDKAAIIRINVLVTCIFSFQFKWKDSIFIDWNYSLHLFGIAQAFDTLFFKNFLNYFFRKIF